MPDIKDLSLALKKQAHGKNKKIKEFEPLHSELKRINDLQQNLRETTIPGTSLSKVVPHIFIKKIEITDNPDTSEIDASNANPHIAKEDQNGSKKSLNDLFVTGKSLDQDYVSVTITISVKQYFDDDELLSDIIRTLNLEKYLKLKIIAVVDNNARRDQIANNLTGFIGVPKPHQIDTNPPAGVYCIGDKSGIPLPYDYSSNLSPLSNDFEMSTDGSIIKNTIIKKTFVFTQAPKELTFFTIAYYDLSNSSDFDKELGASLGDMLDDIDLQKALISPLQSEILFQEGNLINEACVYTETPPSISQFGEPYAGKVLQVRSGLYAKDDQTSAAAGHRHYYYVDSRGDGWTNVHTDRNGNTHVHRISSFEISPSGKFSELEDKFQPHRNSHSHNLGISSSNALYKRKVPVEYIVDNRSQNSLGNLRVDQNKKLEDTFSFLSVARRRSNFVRPINGTSELSPFTSRQSTRKYFTQPMFSADKLGNCRFCFAFDYNNWVRDNTLFGKYIQDTSILLRYVDLKKVTVLRKRMTHVEYSGLKNFKSYDFQNSLKSREYLVVEGSAASSGNKSAAHRQLTGFSKRASIHEFTPAGSQSRRARPARYFSVVDRSYTVSESSVSASDVSKGFIENEEPQLSSGIYVYGVELLLIDNTIDYFLEAQRKLYKNLKDLESYIAIGRRKEMHTGITREFTKAFRSSITDNLAKKIVNESMVCLRKLFLDNTGKAALASDVGFSTRAFKVYSAIRPKSGSLYGAERFYEELKGTISYLKSLTGIEDVGKHAALSRGTTNNDYANGKFATGSRTRIRKVKTYLKDCFKKSDYILGGLDYFTETRTGNHGMSKISQGAIEESLYKGNSSEMIIHPKYARGRDKIAMDLVDTSYIKKSLFSTDTLKERLASHKTKQGMKESTFQIVDNSKILYEKKKVLNFETVRFNRIIGNEDFLSQIKELQEDNYLKEKRRGFTYSQKTNLNSIISGEELEEELMSFLYKNEERIEYFSGFHKVANSFIPIFSPLVPTTLQKLIAENRPILCRLARPPFKSSDSSYGGLRSMNIYNEYFTIVKDSGTKVFSPNSPRESAVLEDYLSYYEAEVLTTNPNVSDGTSGPASTALVSSTTAPSMGGSGGY